MFSVKVSRLVAPERLGKSTVVLKINKQLQDSHRLTAVNWIREQEPFFPSWSFLPGIQLLSLSWQGAGAWGNLGNDFKILRDFGDSATDIYHFIWCLLFSSEPKGKVFFATFSLSVLVVHVRTLKGAKLPFFPQSSMQAIKEQEEKHK